MEMEGSTSLRETNSSMFFIKSEIELRNRISLGSGNHDDKCIICYWVKYKPENLQSCFHLFCSTSISES